MEKLTKGFEAIPALFQMAKNEDLRDHIIKIQDKLRKKSWLKTLLQKF